MGKRNAFENVDDGWVAVNKLSPIHQAIQGRFGLPERYYFPASNSAFRNCPV